MLLSLSVSMATIFDVPPLIRGKDSHIHKSCSVFSLRWWPSVCVADAGRDARLDAESDAGFDPGCIAEDCPNAMARTNEVRGPGYWLLRKTTRQTERSATQEPSVRATDDGGLGGRKAWLVR